MTLTHRIDRHVDSPPVVNSENSMVGIHKMLHPWQYSSRRVQTFILSLNIRVSQENTLIGTRIKVTPIMLMDVDKCIASKTLGIRDFWDTMRMMNYDSTKWNLITRGLWRRPINEEGSSGSFPLEMIWNMHFKNKWKRKIQEMYIFPFNHFIMECQHKRLINNTFFFKNWFDINIA